MRPMPTQINTIGSSSNSSRPSCGANVSGAARISSTTYNAMPAATAAPAHTLLPIRMSNMIDLLAEQQVSRERRRFFFSAR
jgi:hypothetical protein